MDNDPNTGEENRPSNTPSPAKRDWAVIFVVGGILAGFFGPLFLYIASAVSDSQTLFDTAEALLDLCILDWRLWSGELWRLFTHMFVHGGFDHLFGNMLFLVPLLLWVRHITRAKWWLFIFLVTGAAGGFCQLLWSPEAFLVGASGGVAGLLGASMVACVRMICTGRNRYVASVVLALCAVLLLQEAAGEIAAADAKVGHLAHLGGLVCGFLIGTFVPLRGSTESTS